MIVLTAIPRANMNHRVSKNAADFETMRSDHAMRNVLDTKRKEKPIIPPSHITVDLHRTRRPRQILPRQRAVRPNRPPC